MKTAAALSALCISLIGLLSYGAYSNNQMYVDIDTKFSSDPVLKESIGEFQRAILVHNGDDCEYSKTPCFENNLLFKVIGTRGCIYANATVKESFPIYELISVSPSTYGSQKGSAETGKAPAVSLIRGCNR